MNPPETRPSLMLRLSDPRDERAWEQFWEVYEPFLLRLMRQFGLQDSDARDVTQQVLARVAQSVATWEPDGQPASFRRWLFRVARNAVLKFLARRDREPLSIGGTDFLDQLENQPLPDGLELAACERRYQETVFIWAAERVRSEFRESSWIAFWETAVKLRPVSEVAAELGLSHGAIYVARSRIIARLRSQVQQFEDDDVET
jgi:RNA polymerase sigma-70 factor (ECF subfamily)